MRSLGCVLLAMGLTWAMPAHGQNALVNAIPGQRFRPAIGDGILDVYTGDVPRTFELRAGFWANYSHQPVVISQGGGALIRHRLDLDLLVAVVPLPRILVGMAMRVTPFQTRDAELIADYGPVRGGLGDFRFFSKAGLVQGAWNGRFDLALLATLGFADTSKASMLTDTSFVASPELAASLVLSPITLALNLGASLRPPVLVGAYEYGHELNYRFAARFTGERFRVPVNIDLVLSGNTALLRPFGARYSSPLELGGAVNLPLARGAWVVSVAAFGGLVGGYNEPLVRVLAGVSFKHDFGMTVEPARPASEPVSMPSSDRVASTNPVAHVEEATTLPASAPVKKAPRPKPKKPAEAPNDPKADSDGDGIPNAQDAAPYIPEDRDGYQDEDGVPEIGPT